MTLSSRRRELRASIRENIKQAENVDQEDDADKHIDQELRHLQHSHPQEHEATTNHDATKLINTIKREHEEHAGHNNAYDTIKVKREFDNKQEEDDDEEEEEEYQEENEHTEIPNRRRTRNKRQRIELSNTTVAPQTRTILSILIIPIPPFVSTVDLHLEMLLIREITAELIHSQRGTYVKHVVKV